MKIISAIVVVLSFLRFSADNCYEIAYRAFNRNDIYTAYRYLETASALNPTSILISQAEKRTISISMPGQRVLFYHPNDFDALLIATDELRLQGRKQEARKLLYRAAKADPYSSVLKAEALQLR